MSPQQIMSGQRYSALDGLRGVAALAVMLAHFSHMTAFTRGLAAWAGFGVYGVELFFMISGFVIALSLRGKTLRSFVISRFIRLYPIFWVCMAVSWVVRTMLLPEPQQISAARILANATMIPNQFLGITSYLEGSYWTLEMELYFYVMCAICWFAFRRNPIIAVLVAVSLLNVWIDASRMIASLPEYPRYVQSLFMRCYGWLFVQYANLFLIGVATSFRQQLGMTRYTALVAFATAIGMYHNRLQGGLSAWANAVAIVAVVALFLAAVPWPSPENSGDSEGIAGTSWSVSPLRGLQWLLKTPPLLFLGRISYPLYLTHQGIGQMVFLRTTRPGTHAYASLVAAAVLAIVTAALLTILADEPLRRRLTRWIFGSGAANTDRPASAKAVAGHKRISRE